jgi:hypothetical protein
VRNQMTVTPSFNCQYVQPDMIYAGADCTVEIAMQLLDEVMSDDMTQKLLAQEVRETVETRSSSSAMPAYVLSCQWPNGGATLNLFCERQGWSYIWDVRVRRHKWLPLFMKGYTTDPTTAIIGRLRNDIAWMSTAKINDVPIFLRNEGGV